METLLVEMKADNRRSAAIIGDAQKAHWRVKVRKDWVYMACRLVPGKVWLNKVGTCGFASAGYLGSCSMARQLDDEDGGREGG